MSELRVMTPEQMQERQERLRRCQEKIQQALAEEGCLLEAAVLVTERGNFPQVTLVLRE